MADFFKEAVDFTLKNEGILANDNNDKGGLTRFGISSRFYFKVHPDATAENFDNLSLDDAINIYYRYFWQAHSLHLIDHPFSIVVFDQVVNRGFAAIRTLQQALNITTKGDLSVDGIMGPASVSSLQRALDQHRDCLPLLLSFIVLTQKSYINICIKDPSQNDFLKGWINRTLKYATGDFYEHRLPRY